MPGIRFRPRSCARLTVALALVAAVAGCGSEAPGTPSLAGAPATPTRTLSAAQARPAAAPAPATLATIADTGAPRTGFVDVTRLGRLRAPLPAAELTRLALGAAGSARLDAARAAQDRVRTATQVGPATVLDGTGRTVAGGDAALRRELTARRPPSNLIAEELPSAIQTCLGSPAVQTVDAFVAGRRFTAVGVGLVAGSAAAPATLVVCALPHFRRELATVARRLERRLGAAGDRLDVGTEEFGEAELVRGVVPLDAVAAAELRHLLGGGAALRAYAGA